MAVFWGIGGIIEWLSGLEPIPAAELSVNR